MYITQLSNSTLIVEFDRSFSLNEEVDCIKLDFIYWCKNLGLNLQYYHLNQASAWTEEHWLRQDKANICVVELDKEQLLQITMKYMDTNWTILEFDAELEFDKSRKEWGLVRKNE